MSTETITLLVKVPMEEVEEVVFSSESQLFFKYGNIKHVYKRLKRGETWHLLNDTMLPPFPAGSKVTLKHL